MTHCVSHTQCPKCRGLGHDRSGDNLAVYSDGSKYCFRCGYLETASGIQRIRTEDAGSSSSTDREITLPRDVDTAIPDRGRGFLRDFALTEQDVKNNMIMWSDYYKRLIFPYFDSDGLVGWQGRYLGELPSKAKWFSQGDLKNIVHIVGNKLAKTCVIVEDIVSAIKVGHNSSFCAMPLFGSHVSMTKFLQLKKKYGTVYIWLDKDVQTKAVKYAANGRVLGLDVRNIITDNDPKSYTDSQIEMILHGTTTH